MVRQQVLKSFVECRGRLALREPKCKYASAVANDHDRGVDQRLRQRAMREDDDDGEPGELSRQSRTSPSVFETACHSPVVGPLY